LINLSRIVAEYGGAPTRFVEAAIANSPKLRTLYGCIMEGEFTSDQDALSSIKINARSRSSLSELKRRLRKHLIRSILFIEPADQKLNELHRAYNEVSHLWLAAKQLQYLRYSDESVKLAQRGLRIAQKFELTEFVSLLSRIIIINHAIYTKEKSSYLQTLKILESSEISLSAEKVAEQAYLNVIHNFTSSSRSPTVIFSPSWRYLSMGIGLTSDLKTY